MQRYIVGLFLIILLFVFRPVFTSGKVLFPSNLLMSSYAPWRYEPVPEYPNGPPNKPIGFDDVRQFYPNRKLLAESFAKGIIPLWNPYIYSGVPFMAAFDTAVWYPLSWMAALLPTIEGWSFLVIIQPVLSLLFMYLFLKSMKFEPVIAAYGAFVWAFAGFMVVYWQEILVLGHSFLWLPLALYAVNRKDRLGFLLLILSLVCSVFGGFLQMSIYVYIVVFLWNLFVARSKRAYMAIFLSLCVGAIQLIPSIEAFLMSPRGTSEGVNTFKNALLPLTQLLTLVAPDFWGNPATYTYFGGAGFYFEKMVFIGVIPLILGLYTIGQKNKHILFLTVTAVVALSMGFAVPTSWWPNLFHVPVLSNSYPTRIFGVWAFAATVLSCFGLSRLIKEPDYKRLGYVVGGLTVLFIAGWTVVLSSWCITHGYPVRALWCMGKTSVVWDFVGHIPGIYKENTWYATVSLRNLIIPTVFIICGWALVLLKKLTGKAVLLFVVITTLASGIYFAQKYVYFSERRFVYPDLAVTSQISSVAGHDRVWGYGNAFLEKNLPQYFGWFSTDGYGNLSSSRYAELLSTIINKGKLGGPIRRSDTDIYETSERDSMSSNPYRLRMMSILGVKYVLEAKTGDLKDKRTTEERFPAELFTLIWQNNSWRLWLFKEALPRVMFDTRYTVKTAPQEIVDALYDTRTTIGNTVILEKDPGVTLTQTSASGSAHIRSYGMDMVNIETNSDTDGFVLLTDNYYPGWSVTVDGRKGTVYRADYAFRAVFVPKGVHTVIFKYLPLSVIIGGVLSVAGVIAAFIL